MRRHATAAAPEHTVRFRQLRRRRPSGEPPPLPRPIYPSGRVYIATIAAVLVVAFVTVHNSDMSAAITRWDVALLDRLAELRTPIFDDLATATNSFLGSSWTWRLVRWATLVALLVARRFRHLTVYLGLLLAITALTQAAIEIAGRMRPAGVTTLVGWEGYAFPSRPVVTLGLSLVGAMYTLVPRGHRRNLAKAVAATVMFSFVLSRLYLGADHPTDAAVAVVLGMALPVVVFRFLTPDEVFPIRYANGARAARLGAHRESAIRDALATDLGWDLRQVVALRPPGSSGSTPLRLVVRRTDEEGDVGVFAKLYAQQHLRADRWYKLGRTVLYGRLEDEHAFASVRRLVEHEDHVLRVAAASGAPVPATFGYVTLTPEREYLLVTELVPHGEQLGPGVVTDRVIDDALNAVRTLWRAGIAHRDIKPANIVVSDDRVWLVDLSFGELRPSAWREAVDLATMMLCLALYSSPERVYAAALKVFDPDEIGEAFAAARSITIPSQLRSLLHTQAPDLRARFNELVPAHPTISIQRWSARRALLGAGAVAVVGVGLALLVYNLGTVGLL